MKFIYRKGKAACFKILQSSSKFQSMFAALGNDLNISDELLTKLETFVCHICSMLEVVHEIFQQMSEWKQSC